MGVQHLRISNFVRERLDAQKVHVSATRTPPRKRSSKPPAQTAATDVNPNAPHTQAGHHQNVDVHLDTRREASAQVEELTIIAKAQVQARHVVGRARPGHRHGRARPGHRHHQARPGHRHRHARPGHRHRQVAPTILAARRTKGVCAEVVLPKYTSGQEAGITTAAKQLIALKPPPAETQSHSVAATRHTAWVTNSLVLDQ